MHACKVDNMATTTDQVREELDALKSVLNQIFESRHVSFELRNLWRSLTRPPVESPISEPKPPEKGIAQRSLEEIGVYERVLESNGSPHLQTVKE